jgi:hypothetical protein
MDRAGGPAAASCSHSMSATGRVVARAIGDERIEAGRPRMPTAAEVGWVALIPCALVAALAILLLGPPLGHVLFPRPSEGLWPPGWWESQGHADPVKQGRYVVAIVGACLLPTAILVAARRKPTLRLGTLHAYELLGSALLCGVVALSLLRENLYVSDSRAAPSIFGPGTALAAASLVILAMIAMSRPGVMSWTATLISETRGRRWAALAIATCFATAWLLKAVTTERLSGGLLGRMLNFSWTFNDAFAVLDGRTPLVDYHGIYAKLLPYPSALVLAMFGGTALVYTAFMAILTGLTLLAVYGTFRLLTRRSLLALGMFLPFVAMSDHNTLVTPVGAVSPMTLPAIWPMRFGGIYLLAWMTARHLAGLRPRSASIVFLAGGLIAINSMEFGVPAEVATVIALLCAHPPRSMRDILRLGAQIAVGTSGAIATVCLLTLVRAGTLPRPDTLLEWPRIFSALGWFSRPLPVTGLHLAVYVTFAGALAVAAVRLSRGDADRLLTGMLAWSGAFGLLAGTYFVGRPDSFKMDAMLSPWAFALLLLTVVTVRSLTIRGWRWPTLAESLVLFGFGLSVCSLAQMSPPAAELTRLGRTVPDWSDWRTMEQVIAAQTRRGQTVAILVPMGHRIAYDLGLRNISPYPLMNAIVTRAQLQTLIDALEASHVRTIFLPTPGSQLLDEGDSAPQQIGTLVSAGYQIRSSAEGVVELRRDAPGS